MTMIKKRKTKEQRQKKARQTDRQKDKTDRKKRREVTKTQEERHNDKEKEEGDKRTKKQRKTNITICPFFAFFSIWSLPPIGFAGSTGSWSKVNYFRAKSKRLKHKTVDGRKISGMMIPW